jgi:integrase
MAWVEHRRNAFRVRLRLPDGTVVTDSIHETEPTAQLRAKEVDVEIGRDTFLDPRDGRIPLSEWVEIWQETHQAGPATWSAYRSHLRLHLLPRLGHLPINSIRRHHVKTLALQLKTRLAPRSITDVLMVLSLVMTEAVEDRRISHNPCRGVRVAAGPRNERPTATTTQVDAIAARMNRRIDRLLVLTAAYTGMRWGELAGLSRDNLHLEEGIIHVHKHVGALHEVGGKLFLGPPKTADSVRDVHLPPFLIELLTELLASHQHPTVFCGARGRFQRRSNFNRRAWTPATVGNPVKGIAPVVAGMHFHDLRHTHKTWLIEDDIPEVAQAARLGHKLPGVRGVYSHATLVMQRRITDALQHRWTAKADDGDVGIAA